MIQVRDKVAQRLANSIQAPIYEIKPEIPYTGVWDQRVVVLAELSQIDFVESPNNY